LLGPDAADSLPALRDVARDGTEKARAEMAIRAIEAKKR